MFPEPEEAWGCQPVGQLAKGQLQQLVFDDPSTEQTDDYWLHPCDCLNPSFGTGWPVDPASFEEIPPQANGIFVPPPFLLVSGQFVCPSRQLLPGAAGVHFKTEAESGEPTDCQERCQGEDHCHFFWTGTSHGADTCRLFKGCDSLVREFGMEGDLMAFPRTPSCAVANPAACWHSTMRRNFLIQTVGTSPSASHPPAVINQGGHLKFKDLSAKSLTPQNSYEEKLNDLSNVRMTGWNRRLSGYGYFRDAAGIATATVQNLNAHKTYKYTLWMDGNQMDVTNKFSVNHGPQLNVVQRSSRRRRALAADRTAVATPRGELIFEFEATDFPLGFFVSKSGQSSQSSRDCRRRYQITSCNCWAKEGKCAGAKIGTDGVCTAYGNMDVQDHNTYKNPKVEAHASCMALPFKQSVSYQTSSGPSFSWLETGAAANATMADTGEDDDDETAAEIMPGGSTGLLEAFLGD
ncbi:unnamed protein product [Durusdinium trenchii]|uniref:Apple domain-containing protein n=1 Tax=Durusdinium trenchii TaxID=1381693 RepID=A0ABP0HU10_9DINO